MANLTTLNKKITINTAYLNNPDSKESLALNSRRIKEDLNNISSYINEILHPMILKVASGERFPYDVTTYGLGGNTLITHLESAGNNSSNTRLYWINQRPTTIKESFDFINSRINDLTNLINLNSQGAPDLLQIQNQLDDHYQYILQLFKESFGDQNESHHLQNPAPEKPEYTLSNLIYHLYNQLIDVSLNGEAIPDTFFNVVDQSVKNGLTLSLKNNLFVTELENLTDVDVANKTDSQVLSWNEAQGKWIPVDKDSGPGYTSTTYNAATGQVTFNSDYPELVLTTGDLRGPAGATGSDGEDALWNVRGPWDIDGVYAIGDVVQYNGSTYYKHSDPMGMTDIPMQPNWYLISEKGDNGIPGPAGADGQQGPQGPEGPTGPLKLLSDVYDLLTPQAGEALIYSATNFGDGPEMWNSGKIALGYNTVNDYVSSVNSAETPANEWITITSNYDPEASGEKTVGIKFNKEKLFENNGNGKIKSTLLPSYVDDVVEYADLNSFPNAQSASTGIIYVALDTNKAYRWSGNTYVEISASIGQASGLNGNVTFNLTGDVTGSVATSLQAGSTVTIPATIQPNSVALGTDTTGSYVSSLVAGAGITLSNNAGESATPTISLTSGIATVGTYKSVTVDTYGRVTAGTNPTTLAGYGITDAQPLDSDLTNIAGLVGTSGYLKKTAANTWTLDDSLGNSSITVSDGNISEAIASGETLRFTGTLNEVTVGYAPASNTFNFSLPDNINANASTASNLHGRTSNRLLYQSSPSSTGQIVNGAQDTFLVSNSRNDFSPPSFKTLTVKQSILLSQQSELPMQFSNNLDGNIYPPNTIDSNNQDNSYSIYNTRFFTNPPSQKGIRNLRSFVLFNNNFKTTITVKSINVTLGSLRSGTITFQLIKYSSINDLLTVDNTSRSSTGGSLIGDPIPVALTTDYFAAASTTVDFSTPITFQQGQFLGLVCVNMTENIVPLSARKLIVNIFGEMDSIITLA